jgi:SAM-dependent MidA family methyltransferase
MGLFLQRLGLMARSAMLARSEPSQAGNILSAAQRLVAPEGMGRLFKALTLSHPALPAPAGFEG